MQIEINEFMSGYWESSADHPIVGKVTGLGPSAGEAWQSCAWQYRNATRNPTEHVGCGFPCRCPKTHGELQRDKHCFRQMPQRGPCPCRRGSK